MGALGTKYLTREKAKMILDKMDREGLKGIYIDISISDKTDSYGNNIAEYYSQTKEQRDNKDRRVYLANGRVFWTDGTIKKAERKQEENEPF
jgi:hypothetical protein